MSLDAALERAGDDAAHGPARVGQRDGRRRTRRSVRFAQARWVLQTCALLVPLAACGSKGEGSSTQSSPEHEPPSSGGLVVDGGGDPVSIRGATKAPPSKGGPDAELYRTDGGRASDARVADGALALDVSAPASALPMRVLEPTTACEPSPPTVLPTAACDAVTAPTTWSWPLPGEFRSWWPRMLRVAGSTVYVGLDGGSSCGPRLCSTDANGLYIAPSDGGEWRRVLDGTPRLDLVAGGGHAYLAPSVADDVTPLYHTRVGSVVVEQVGEFSEANGGSVLGGLARNSSWLFASNVPRNARPPAGTTVSRRAIRADGALGSAEVFAIVGGAVGMVANDTIVAWLEIGSTALVVSDQQGIPLHVVGLPSGIFPTTGDGVGEAALAGGQILLSILRSDRGSFICSADTDSGVVTTPVVINSNERTLHSSLAVNSSHAFWVETATPATATGEPSDRRLWMTRLDGTETRLLACSTSIEHVAANDAAVYWTSHDGVSRLDLSL